MALFRILLGPFAGKPGVAWFALHLCLLAGLTALTQVGGAAYWLAVGVSRVSRRALVGWLVFAVLYAGLTAAAVPRLAPAFGRTALPCFSGLALQPASPLFCALNRHYVRPEVAAVADDVVRAVAREFPGSRVAYLDGSFPFLNGFPILPHLTHDDGRKLDLALFYRGRDLGGAWPLGYLAFAPAEALAGEVCPDPGWRRWQVKWLQPMFADVELDAERTSGCVRALARHPDVRRVFFDGGLTEALGLSGEKKIGRAGCHASRHDEHVHFRVSVRRGGN